MRLLLLSNSTNAGEAFLQYPAKEIKSFLGQKKIKAIFIPYAAVTFSFDDYENKVQEAFSAMGYDIESIHPFENPLEKIERAECIVVGGGNTFRLLQLLQQKDLIKPIYNKIKNRVPYIGCSAGANLACPTICTTNDMPITEVNGFSALNFIPFQINPHYTDISITGHGGETRDQRIFEYLTMNPNRYVVGLREGTIIKLENSFYTLIGNQKAKIFKSGLTPYEADGEDLNRLFNNM